MAMMVCDKDFAEAFPSVLLIATYVVLMERMQICVDLFGVCGEELYWHSAIAATSMSSGVPL